MILGRELLTNLGLYLKFSENFMIGIEVPYKVCSAPMVDMSNYNFESITDITVKLEESFINLYIDKEFESNNAIKSTNRMRRILDVKYENSDLN